MKLSVAAFAVALVASASGAVQEKQQNFLHHSNPRAYYEDRFLTWMTEFGLTFSDSEYEARLATFAHSEDVIARNNANPAASITMAHNPFSHMTWPEFKSAKSLGRPLLTTPARPLNILPSKSEAMASSRKLADLPKEVDWHKAGAVTPVKNQEQCGSCWSYSTTGALEGAYFVKHKQLVSFSEQMLVDCDTYDSGCGGGLMDFAFHWIQENGGLCAEDDYPYTGVGGVCAASACKSVPGSQVVGWKDVGNTKEDLMQAVSERPVAVAIEADEMAFQFYKDGVLTAGCGTNLDHGVLLTGYGTTENGVDYWMVKNSWGPEWGSSGYIKLLRGAPQEGGECGILMQASYPVLGDA